MNGYISDLTLVQYGIPQGSLLGPRLYSIYVNDLPDAITLGKVLMYADDTTIYCMGKSFDEVCFKSLSTRGPGRRDTCHLTDFSQTFTDD